MITAIGNKSSPNFVITCDGGQGEIIITVTRWWPDTGPVTSVDTPETRSSDQSYQCPQTWPMFMFRSRRDNLVRRLWKLEAASGGHSDSDSGDHHHDGQDGAHSQVWHSASSLSVIQWYICDNNKFKQTHCHQACLHILHFIWTTTKNWASAFILNGKFPIYNLFGLQSSQNQCYIGLNLHQN